MKYTAMLILDVLVAQEPKPEPYTPAFKREHWSLETDFKNGTNPLQLAQDYDQGWKHFTDHHLFIEDRKDEDGKTVWYKPQCIHPDSMLYRALPKFGFTLVPLAEAPRNESAGGPINPQERQA